MEIYAVRVGREELGFAAGHFIALGDGGCESLHGHNFRVAAEVEAPLDADSLVIDFVLLKRIVEEVLVELDHKVLLPAKSLQEEREIRNLSRDRRDHGGRKSTGLVVARRGRPARTSTGDPEENQGQADEKDHDACPAR